MEIFKISENTQKVKTKVLGLSGICLFIGLTKTLPEKVEMLGLDLSNAPDITGWFLLAITLYFLLKFLASAILEIVNYHLPEIIGIKTKNTTGNIIGLTLDECFKSYENHENLNNAEMGTVHGEQQDIQEKNQNIAIKIRKNFVFLNNIYTYAINILLPTGLCVVGIGYLFMFLKTL